MYLSDASIKRTPFAKGAEGYRIVDSDLPGLFLHVGRDFKSIRLKIEVEGKTKGFSWLWPDVPADEAREKAEEYRRRRNRGEPLEGPTNAVTLLEAWQGRHTRGSEPWLGYKKQMETNNRSAGTIKLYDYLVMHVLKPLHQRPLRAISRDEVQNLHSKIKDAGVPVRERADGTKNKRKPRPTLYVANAAMRVARALYNFVADKELKQPESVRVPLPVYNPFRSTRNDILLTKESVREVEFNEDNLPQWFEQLKALPNPIWREFFFLTMLTGLRRRTVDRIRLDEISGDHIHIPTPKGGEQRAFDLPISKPMRRSIERAIRAGASLRGIFPRCEPWLFPSDRSEDGHVAEPKSQDIGTAPHDLRHTFRLFAANAGVAELHSEVLMNHSTGRKVHNRYAGIKAMDPALVAAQERISAYILEHMGKGVERTLEQLLERDLRPVTPEQERRDRAKRIAKRQAVRAKRALAARAAA